MKKLVWISLLLLTACSGVKTSFDYDKNSDFSKFKTYGYAEDVAKLPIPELDRGRVITAIDKQMTAKGFTKSTSPDVWIDLQVKLEQKTEATATNTGGGMYGRPYRYGYAGGFSTTYVNVENYVVGTLFINMIEKTSEKMVWQGRGTKTLSEDVSPEKKEQNINYAVEQIFKKYPPVRK